MTPAWQGFRELLEKALVSWDWAESFVVFNLVLKPAVDVAVLRQLGNTGRHNDDILLGMLSDAQLRDSERHRRWSKALVSLALENSNNKAVLSGWLDKWMPMARNAVKAYCSMLPDADQASEDALQELGESQTKLEI